MSFLFSFGISPPSRATLLLTKPPPILLKLLQLDALMR